MGFQTTYDNAKIIRDREAGMSVADIMRKYGCSQSHVRKVTRKAKADRAKLIPEEIVPRTDGHCAHLGCGRVRRRGSHLCGHHDNPRFFPLDFLPPNQRNAYDDLRDAGRSREEAMREIGRSDLVTAEIVS